MPRVLLSRELVQPFSSELRVFATIFALQPIQIYLSLIPSVDSPSSVISTPSANATQKGAMKKKLMDTLPLSESPLSQINRNALVPAPREKEILVNERISSISFLNRSDTGYLAQFPRFVHIDNYDVRLPSLIIRDMCATPRIVYNTILQHYTSRAHSTVAALLGSAGISPQTYTFAKSIGSEYTETFYPPIKGITNIPRFGTSVKGQNSTIRMKNVADGIFENITKVTGNFGMAVTFFTLDEQYASERARLMSEKPKHAGEGIAQGVRQLGRGFLNGFTGIITSPFQGAQKEGALGLFKGIGKGVLGIVAKPAAGIVDMTTKMIEGVRNSTTNTDTPTRVRSPRYFYANGLLTCYNARTSLGGFWLDRVVRVSPQEDVDDFAFVGQTSVTGMLEVVFLTTARLLFLRVKQTDLDQVFAERIIPLGSIVGTSFDESTKRMKIQYRKSSPDVITFEKEIQETLDLKRIMPFIKKAVVRNQKESQK